MDGGRFFDDGIRTLWRMKSPGPEGTVVALRGQMRWGLVDYLEGRGDPPKTELFLVTKWPMKALDMKESGMFQEMKVSVVTVKEALNMMMTTPTKHILMDPSCNTDTWSEDVRKLRKLILFHRDGITEGPEPERDVCAGTSRLDSQPGPSTSTRYRVNADGGFTQVQVLPAPTFCRQVVHSDSEDSLE